MNAPSGSTFEREFPNELESLSRVIDEAVRFLEEKGVGPRAIYIAHLAIEEIATNILKYAYPDTAHHKVLLRVQIDPGALLVVLEDDGRAFNPLDAPQPDVNLPLEQRDPGGLGIHLVRKLAGKMDYLRCSGRNRLTVRIDFGPES